MITSIEDFAGEVIVMSRILKVTKNTGVSLAAITAFLFLSVAPRAFAEPAGTAGSEPRTSVSSHRLGEGREGSEKLVDTAEEYDDLVTSGDRNKSDTRSKFAKPGSGTTGSQSASFDFWVYEADVILFNDRDNDGYFHGIDLLFDVDTVYSAADIYAVLYLSFEGGPWNEYAVTEDFTIFGSSGSDEYVLVTELMSGYPAGSYDLLIEVFDAFDGSFLTSFGPADTSALGYLPLEDFDRDTPVAETRVVVNRGGGGGAMDGWILGAFLLVLIAGAVRKTWRRRNDMLVRIDTPAPCWRNDLHSGK